MEVTEYAAFDLFLSFIFRFPSTPRKEQTYKCTSIYKFKEQIEKDSKVGRMRKKYQVISTPESIQFGCETILKGTLMAFNDTNVLKVEVNVGRFGKDKAFLEYEVIETKN